MTTRFVPTDEAIREVFERRASRGTAGDVHATILAQTESMRQARRPLRLRLPALASQRSVGRVLALTILLAALLGLGIAVAGSRPVTPDPSASPRSERVSWVGRQFEYTVPPAFDAKLIRGAGEMVAFTEGGDDAYGRAADGTVVPSARGITIASAHGAVTHPCPLADGSSRVPVREAPSAFIDDLRTIGGIGLGVPTPITFDGRQALSVDVDPGTARCTLGDFHVSGGGVGSGFVELGVPSRLIVTDIDGMTIVLQVWARTENDLQAWLPTATEFLDSIHFAK